MSENTLNQFKDHHPVLFLLITLCVGILLGMLVVKMVKLYERKKFPPGSGKRATYEERGVKIMSRMDAVNFSLHRVGIYPKFFRISVIQTSPKGFEQRWLYEIEYWE